MKASEAHNMRDDELVERLRQAREEQFALRLQHSTGELENTARIGEARRDCRQAAYRRQGARNRPRARAESVMAEEEKNEQQEQEEQAEEKAPEAEAEEKAPEAEAEAPAEEAPAEEAPEEEAEEAPER